MRTTFTILILALMFTAGAQTPQTDFAIRFKSGNFTPGAASLPENSITANANEKLVAGKFFRIIQFTRIPDHQEKELLKAAGIELMAFLPVNAWFAAIDKTYDHTILGTMPVRAVLPVETRFKMDISISDGPIPPHALRESGKIAVNVGYYPVISPEQAVSLLSEQGLSPVFHDTFGKYFEIVIPVNDIDALAEEPWVMYLEPVAPEPEPENYTGRTQHHGNAIATDMLNGRHYDGSGVQVVLQDDGIIGPHIDYQGRIAAMNTFTNSGDHGDHCAGIMMGGGNLDPKGKGNAFGADIHVYGTNPNWPGFTSIPTTYGSLGIRVTSCSYGDGCNAGYTSLTRTLDQQVRLYSGLMHVFSAGNSGTENCGYGAGSGWGNITGGHKQGKNVIAAANLTLQDELSSSSSRGPAHDGRIKPDVASKGTDVYSTINPNNYGVKSGTSMACPGVAGTLAQLIQGYRELYNGNDPTAGLLKGILLNTAEDLGNPGPDFKFGWGRINALRAIRVMEEARFDSGVVSQGTAGTHPVVVPAGTAQLRVMVYWTDYEATANASIALVNDLDIKLTDPATATWNPWVLSHYPHPDSLNKPAARGTDRRNNMEQVTLNSPAPGTYQLTVTGTTVPQGPQTYYVIYEFIPETVELTYPVGGESWVPGETELIRWDAFGNTGPFSLHYSLNNGQDWILIADNINGTSRAYSWQVPPVATGKVVVKITRGSSMSQNTEPFSIFGQPCDIKADWTCGDAIHLSWSPVPGAISYDIFRLGEKYMDSVATTAQNFIILTGNPVTGSTWLSVRANGPDDATGRRTIAIENPSGNMNCHQTDAMMETSVTGQWGQFQRCMDISAVPVTVKIRNAGSEAFANPTIHYRFDNGAVVTETWPGSLQPGNETLFTFSQKINLAQTASPILKTWVTVSGDDQPQNDTLTYPLVVSDGTTLPNGSAETFESWTKCSSAPVCDLISCDLEGGWINLTNGMYDQHDWRTFSGNTPTSGSGPGTDHTTGTSNGKYLYIEPTQTCLNRTASILTPCLDLSGAAPKKFTLWYHAFGADIGALHIDLFDGDGFQEDITPVIEGSKGDEWKELTVGLIPWTGKKVSLRIRGVTSCKDKGDLAIDDFRVSEILTGTEPAAQSTKGFTLQPNPAREEVTVILPEPGNPGQKLLVRDMLGRVVYQQSLKTESNSSERINLNGKIAGIYLVELFSNGLIYREKLVIR